MLLGAKLSYLRFTGARLIGDVNEIIKNEFNVTGLKNVGLYIYVQPRSMLTVQ